MTYGKKTINNGWFQKMLMTSVAMVSCPSSCFGFFFVCLCQFFCSVTNVFFFQQAKSFILWLFYGRSQFFSLWSYRRYCRGDESEGKGRKKEMNGDVKTEEITTVRLNPYLLQGQQVLPNCKPISDGRQDTWHLSLTQPYQIGSRHSASNRLRRWKRWCQSWSWHWCI